MNTEQLIASLSASVPRVSRHALAGRIGFGVVAGTLVAMLALVAVLGVRPDLQLAMHGFAFWMKWTYTISLGLGAIYAVSRLARPVPTSLRGLWLLSIPVLVLAGIGIGELASTPSGERNSREGRRWPSNLRRDPRIRFAVYDGPDWVGLSGRVTHPGRPGRRPSTTSPRWHGSTTRPRKPSSPSRPSRRSSA